MIFVRYVEEEGRGKRQNKYRDCQCICKETNVPKLLCVEIFYVSLTYHPHKPKTI